jgi:microsomal dipeptidase-like Zn-dependent dipeptidase
LKRVIKILVLVFLLVSPILSESKSKTEKVIFDAQEARSYIKALSSDSMQGRESGEPSAAMAEEYIASKFKEWALEPAGDNNTYFQNFTVEHRHIEEGVKLEIITQRERRGFYYGEDWRVQSYSGSGNFTAEIVFVGYGIHAPEKNYDDYAGVDVKGKVVLLAIGTPLRIAKELSEAVNMDKRVEAAQKLGARGIMAFSPRTPGQTAPQEALFRMEIKKELYKPDFVMLSTTEDRVANFIFKDLAADLRSLLREVDTNGKPQSLATGVKAFIAVNSIFDEKRPSRNILAKITGADKVLKNEFVVIGAHMDHLGISPMGEVMNGANDNASGTAVVMEIARVMMLNRAKPKRTVVFGLWAGEEQGLLGSKYYADHPPYLIEKTIAYINMDMVGQGSGKIGFSGVYYGPQVWGLLQQKLSKDLVDSVNPSRGGPGGSDHTPFLEKGVPGFFMITQGSVKYHTSRDDLDLIKPEMLKKTGDFVYAAVEVLASEPGDFLPPLRQETYYLKYQNVINYRFNPASEFITNHGDAKDSHVDLQLSVIEEKEGLVGEALRVDIINSLLDLPEKIKTTKGLSAFSSPSRLSMDVRQGKTTLMAGLKGVRSFRDNLKWTEVLAKQGAYYVLVDDPSFLFDEKGLTEEGKKVVEALNSSGLLLFVKGANSSQGKALLTTSKKPLVLLEKDLPDQEVMKLIKEKEAALGLIMGSGEEPAAYFKKLDEAKKAIGAEYIAIVNEKCLWGKETKDQMLKVISEMLKAKYKSADLSNIYSSTFLRVFNKVRTPEAQPATPFPFF